MPRKKTEDEVVETAAVDATEEAAAVEETAVEAAPAVEEIPVAEAAAEEAVAEDSAPVEAAAEETVAVAAEEKPKKATRKKSEKADEPKTVAAADAKSDSDSAPAKKESKRAERIGIVSSDKMTKTVVVRVDRQVKHPIYRKYIKRRKNFMAHDEMGATVGDKVRIVETRPLSARKRWRVVEIIQKAEK
jgi:small subunit ribosomal protein S17